MREGQIGPLLALSHCVAQIGSQERCRVARSQIVFVPLLDDGRGRMASAMCLDEHADGFDRIKSDVGARLLLQLEAVAPRGKFVCPGFDRVDIAPWHIGNE